VSGCRRVLVAWAEEFVGVVVVVDAVLAGVE
jgi:hypothetical protein